MSGIDLFPLLVTIAGSGVIATVITVLAQRRQVDATSVKTKAEAAQILSATAIDQVLHMSRKLAAVEEAVRSHREWDKAVLKIIKDVAPNIDIADPPDILF